MQSSGTQTLIGYQMLLLISEGADTYLTMVMLLDIKIKTTFVENECSGSQKGEIIQMSFSGVNS